MTISAAVVAIVGSLPERAAAQSDITRYAKDAKTSWGGTIFGYLITNTFCYLSGIFYHGSDGEDDLPVAFWQWDLGFTSIVDFDIGAMDYKR